MKTLNLVQGSQEWLAHRRTVRNASEASVMMGAFPTFSRRELVRLIATGLEREFSDYVQKFILDRGHRVEPALRAFAERLIGEELYPVTGVSDDGRLGASFDGVTLTEEIIAEAKQSSAEKFEHIARGEIPPQDYWQVVQQFAVCETAERCIYLVGDGTEEGTKHLWVDRSKIEQDIPRLRAGWDQFDADVESYAPEPTSAPAVAAPVEGFGALTLRVEGRVLASNLDQFRSDADAFLARLPKAGELETDQDFADAESAVKACAEAEARIKAAIDAALAQMSDVDAVMRAAGAVSETIRAARLALDRAVKAEKENRRTAIVSAGVKSVLDHYTSINSTLGEYSIGAPASLSSELGTAIKGRRTISSITDAVDAAVAQAKIAASQRADAIRVNVAILQEYADWLHIIPGPVQLVHTKQPDDLRNFLTNRVAEYQRQLAEDAKAELAKQEAERIRAEEQAKAELAAQNFEGITNDAGVAQPVEHLPSKQAVAGSTPAARSTIKLGQINDAIAPLTITAAGLAQLGFDPVAKERAAVLYDAADFDRVVAALIARLESARVENRRAA